MISYPHTRDAVKTASEPCHPSHHSLSSHPFVHCVLSLVYTLSAWALGRRLSVKVSALGTQAHCGRSKTWRLSGAPSMWYTLKQCTRAKRNGGRRYFEDFEEVGMRKGLWALAGQVIRCEMTPAAGTAGFREERVRATYSPDVIVLEASSLPTILARPRVFSPSET